MKIPNKHENLFPLNSPLFTLKCVMFCLLSLVIWVIISYSQHIKLLSISRTSIFFFVLANIISIVSTFYLIPTILKDLSIISNVTLIIFKKNEKSNKSLDWHVKRSENHTRSRHFPKEFSDSEVRETI